MRYVSPEVNVAVQHLLKRYSSRQQLLEEGIWESRLYDAEEQQYFDRGWCWKTLLLSELTEDEWCNQGELLPTKRNSMIRNLTMTTDPLRNIDETNSDINSEQSSVYAYPARSSPVKGDDRLKEWLSVEEQLEIIRLDVKRILLNPVFSEQTVQDDMTYILLQYIKDTGKPYKQGYHELCAVLYYQLYKDNHRECICSVVLQMLKQLLQHVAPTFYNEQKLIQWTTTTFEPMLKHATPQLYEQLVQHHQIDNSMWLIRWARLLFTREFDLSYTLHIWDHILTWKYYAEDIVAAVAVVCLSLVAQELHSCEDVGDLLSLLLHYPAGKLIEPSQLMQASKQLIEFSYQQQPLAMQRLCDSLIRLHNSSWYTRMKNSSDGGQRLRMEERLKRRVESQLKRRSPMR